MVRKYPSIDRSRPRLLKLWQIAVKNCFIRGSVVRYVQLPADAVDTQLLEDATRRGPHCVTCGFRIS